MRTNRKAVKEYLLNTIDLEGYTTHDGRPFTPQTDNDKINCAMAICRQEVGHIESQDGIQAMVEYWFSGLCSVVSLPYLYGDIIPLAVEWNSLPEDYTEKQADKICENWFKYLACQFVQMYNKANK